MVMLSLSKPSVTDWGDVLLRNTAPNALFNSADRFDPPKCDEDTRTEVIGEIMSWIQDRELPCRLLCMTGAAGAGKSALQQTISERCSKANILAASFFFQANDHTRNDVMRIIPTIAYQLGLKSTPLRDLITRSVEEDPMVFLRSLDGQIQQLILEPLERLRSRPDSKFNSLPHAIIIDGLDECYGEEMQEMLLLAIQGGLLDNDLPFRIVISSRPEWAIRNALARTGHLHGKAYHIRLSDDFDATGDIRRTLWRRLREIGGRSNDPRAKDPSWPSEQDVKAIVEASSGQYIYAATVIRYVSEKRSSPVERLRTILTWTPDAEQRAKPFATLDRLYTNIVSSAKVAYESVDTNKPIFLLLLRAYRMHKLSQELFLLLRCPLPEASHSRLVELDSGGAETLLSDLQSLVTLEATRTDDGYRYKMLRYYHKSFGDFLDSESRAGELYVSSEAAQEHVAVTHLRYIKSLEVPGT
ncbi:hypothetical protein D9611_000878 [Ephemerocybe angulata]|uniref:Nephrocystin 3-like N-terminal domain-containing protein n=1 Tax=Ephemerocybe angulata TaxID=980116 RepID=A0A8H5BMD0_9AGAR|nr:hypothetical protein D9611_000878 [Tulosesus angulatus]